jgi:hypothetical protein
MTRNRENDTDPARLSGDPTDPGGPPGSMQEGSPATEQATKPEPSEEELRELRELLDPFKQVAPKVPQRASSDGAAFVAYSTVAAPARSADAEAHRRRAVEDLQKLIVAPDPELMPREPRRELEATHVGADKRSPPLARTLGLILAGCLLVVAAVLLFTRMRPAASGTANASAESARPVESNRSSPPAILVDAMAAASVPTTTTRLEPVAPPTPSAVRSISSAPRLSPAPATPARSVDGPSSATRAPGKLQPPMSSGIERFDP